MPNNYQCRITHSKGGKVKTLLMSLVLVSIASANPGFMLTVKPGRLLEGFDMGLDFGRFVPSFGVDFGYASINSTYRTETPDTTYSSAMNTSILAALPHIGFKYFLSMKEMRPYLGMSFLYTIGSARGEIDGVEDEETSNFITDLISGNIGIGVYFGGEFLFSKNFSINGAIGAKYMMGSADLETEYAPGYLDIIENSLGLGISDVNWGFNFYF